MTINDRYSVDGLIYKETGPENVQLIGFAKDNTGFTQSKITGLDLSSAKNMKYTGAEAFDGCTGLKGAIVTVDEDVRVTGNVTIESGAEVTVSPGKTITVEPGGTIIIESGAAVTGEGTIIVKTEGALIGEPDEGVTVEKIHHVTVVNGGDG